MASVYSQLGSFCIEMHLPEQRRCIASGGDLAPAVTGRGGEGQWLLVLPFGSSGLRLFLTSCLMCGDMAF